MKKQEPKSSIAMPSIAMPSIEMPSPESESERTAPNVRRPARHYLYGPVSVGLRGDEQNLAGMSQSPEQGEPNAGTEAIQLPEQAPVEEQNQLADENIQPSDTRARQLVSGILETEKRNLPDWMSELLDPMDETAQLAFILKHRAEINATRRGRLAVPASPVTGNPPQHDPRIAQTHRRVYDTF